MSFSVKTLQPNIAMAIEPDSTSTDTNLLLEGENSIVNSAPKQTSKTNQETVRTSSNSGFVIKSSDNASEDYL